MSVVRAAGTECRTLPTPGVAIKVLRRDTTTGASTFLLRLNAGARFPLHDHPEHGCILCVSRPLPVRIVEPRG